MGVKSHCNLQVEGDVLRDLRSERFGPGYAG